MGLWESVERRIMLFPRTGDAEDVADRPCSAVGYVGSVGVDGEGGILLFRVVEDVFLDEDARTRVGGEGAGRLDERPEDFFGVEFELEDPALDTVGLRARGGDMSARMDVLEDAIISGPSVEDDGSLARCSAGEEMDAADCEGAMKDDLLPVTR